MSNSSSTSCDSLLRFACFEDDEAIDELSSSSTRDSDNSRIDSDNEVNVLFCMRYDWVDPRVKT